MNNFLFFAELRMPVEVYTNVMTMANCQACLHPHGVFITTTLSIYICLYTCKQPDKQF